MNYVEELEERYSTKNFEKLLGKMSDREYKHFMDLQSKSPVYNKNVLTNTVKDDIITLKIHKSLGAAAKNYPVKLPGSSQHVKLAEGQTLKGKVFAGKGSDVEIRERFRLESTYNLPAEEWQKVSGNGIVVVDGKEKKAEIHWYQANNTIVEMKVKRFNEDS